MCRQVLGTSAPELNALPLSDGWLTPSDLLCVLGIRLRPSNPLPTHTGGGSPAQTARCWLSTTPPPLECLPARHCADDIYTFDVILEAAAAEGHLVPQLYSRKDAGDTAFLLGMSMLCLFLAPCRWALKRRRKVNRAPEIHMPEVYDMGLNDAARHHSSCTIRS